MDTHNSSDDKDNKVDSKEEASEALETAELKELAQYGADMINSLKRIQNEFAPIVVPFFEAWEDYRKNTLLPLFESFSPVIDNIRQGLAKFDKYSKPLTVIYKLSEIQYVLWDVPDLDLQNLILASSDINKTLFAYHQSNKYSLINDTVVKCMAHPMISPYARVFEQAHEAFVEGKAELSCIGLVTIIDGLLPLNNSPKRKTDFKKRIECLYDKVVQNEELANEEYNLFILYMTFKRAAELLFNTSDFSQPEPAYLNRHWIMHGRSVQPKTKLDCIKLIHVIYGLILLQDLADKDNQGVGGKESCSIKNA